MMLAAFALAIATQPPATPAPVLRQGVSVQMPVTRNAVPMPAADAAGAVVVAVTANGALYWDVTRVSPPQLAEKLKTIDSPPKLFLKADARAPWEAVGTVLDALRAAGIPAAQLLTAQKDASDAQTAVVPPKGLEVFIGPAQPGALSVLLRAPQPSPLSVAGDSVALPALADNLAARLRGRAQRLIAIGAGGPVPFGEVIAAIDAGRAAGALVFLSPPGR
jgi:biopolymer transport protein ExbD